MLKRAIVPCVRQVIAVATAGALLVACTGEEPVPIDLDATVPDAAPPTIEGEDPNAAERARLDQLARQQCLDDPDKAEGIVRIVDPQTNEVVSELIIDCDEVR